MELIFLNGGILKFNSLLGLKINEDQDKGGAFFMKESRKGKKKKFGYLFLTFVMFISVLAACSTGETTKVSSDEATKEDPIVIRLSSGLPATNHVVKNVLERWASEVEKKSEGRIKVEKFFGGSLHDSTESITALKNDITDLTEVWAGYYPGQFEMSNIEYLPQMAPNAYVAALIGEELYADYLKEEFETLGVQLAFMGAYSNKVFITKEPVRSLEDLKGMNIRAGNPIETKYLQALGATPVSLPSSEVYTGLERGMIGGAHYHISGGTSFRLFEVTDYVTLNGAEASSTLSFGFNPKTWKELPSDLQKIIYETNMDASMWVAESYENLDKEGLEAKEWEFITLPDEEIQKINKISEKVHDEVISELEEKGYPAREYYDKYRELSEKYGKMSIEELLDYRNKNLTPMDELY